MPEFAPKPRASTSALADDLRQRSWPRCARAGRRSTRSATPRRASCSSASASTACWTPARPSWSCRRWRPGAVRRPGPRRGDRHRDRAGGRARGDDRGQRRHGQGRHLFPADHAQSTCAPRRSPSRTTCPASTWSIRAASSCPCRMKSSPIGRFWAHLLQPGAHERQGHPADRGGDGLLHRRGRLRPGDER